MLSDQQKQELHRRLAEYEADPEAGAMLEDVVRPHMLDWMTRRFIVRPRAERDIESAYRWYESERVRQSPTPLTVLTPNSFPLRRAEATPLLQECARQQTGQRRK